MTLQSVGRAFGLATLYWSVIYLVVVHLFVLWKWESYSISPRSRAALQNQTQKPEKKQEIRTLVVDETAQWTQTIDSTRSAIETTEADIHRMEAKQARLQDALQRMNRALDNLVGKEKLLQEAELKLPSLPPTKEEQFVVFHDGEVAAAEYLEPFRRLVSVSDLGEIGNTKDLQQTFASVSEAMDKYLEEAGDSVQWASINKLVRDDYPVKSSQLSSCPVITDDEEEDATAQVDSEGADDTTASDVSPVTEEDLSHRQDEIRALWESLYEDRALPVSDDEIKRLEKIRQGLVDKWVQRVQESLDEALDKVELAKAQSDAVDEEELVGEVVETEEKDSVKCAKTDDVLAILEDGIDAVHRKKDLRVALQAAMKARDGDLGDVIFDADLPLGEARPRVSGPSTLRQYLDSALLVNDVSEWINALVDLTGGFHDKLDDFIESLPDNVGKVAVRKALEAAGYINLNEIQGHLSGYLAGAKKQTMNLMS